MLGLQLQLMDISTTGVNYCQLSCQSNIRTHRRKDTQGCTTVHSPSCSITTEEDGPVPWSARSPAPATVVRVANHTSAPSPTETTAWSFEVKSNYCCGTSPRTVHVCVCIYASERDRVHVRACVCV